MALYETIINNSESTTSIANTLFNFNSAMEGYVFFTVLLALFVILASAIYSFTNDLIDSVSQSSYLVTVIALLLFIIDLSGGNRLLSWEQFTFFLGLTGLIIGYKKLSD